MTAEPARRKGGREPDDMAALVPIRPADPSPEAIQKAKVERATEAKKAFHARVQHATLVSGALLNQEGSIGIYARGAAAMMLVKILNGDVEPKDAEQAMKVAKIALDIASAEGIDPEATGLDDDGKRQLAAEMRDKVAKLAANIASREGITLPSDPT